MSISENSINSFAATASVYNRRFWLAYLANVMLVTANALTFHFAELVAYLGGSEQLTGSVIRTGLVGALLIRLWMGNYIDRYGVGPLWMISSAGLALGLLSFTFIDAIGWELHAARVLFSISLAGMFTCSMVHIQNHVPPERRTEVIGNLGSSGFVGMIIGSNLGDFLMNIDAAPPAKFHYLFGTAALMAVGHFFISAALTWKQPHEKPKDGLSSIQLLVRYWPGPVVAVGIVMGTVFAVTTVFLSRYSTAIGLNGIGTFFTAYAISAFCFRIMTSGWSYRFGRHMMVLYGLAGHFFALCSLVFVTQEWHYILPAICGGFGHALLFPAVVSLGAGAFPKRYRGMGTTLALGFVEAGTMISAPILGMIIDHFATAEWSNYGFTPMYLGAAGVTVFVAIYYGFTAARVPDTDDIHVEDKMDEPSSAKVGGAVSPLKPEPALACESSER